MILCYYRVLIPTICPANLLTGQRMMTPLSQSIRTELDARLPPVRERERSSWSQTYGTDYYGALEVAAQYCGLPRLPAALPGSWQHGTIPPWHRLRPEVVVYDAPRSMRCFVARKDEEVFLREGGYRDVRAIGLPILYTQPSGLDRIPNSLLVMPTHSLASDVLMPSCEDYVREIAGIAGRFDAVAACVSAYCVARNLWVPEFAEHGIPAVRGAGIADIHALERMRALFESFEHVTTDSYGSHVFYALYFGAKVSIWGPATPVFRENILKDGGWAAYPDTVDALFSPRVIEHGERYLAPLRVPPWEAVCDRRLGAEMLGEENRLSPKQLRKAFGWTTVGKLRGAAMQKTRSSWLWRGARALRRRLIPTRGSW
jgi:hypothetical protein